MKRLLTSFLSIALVLSFLPVINLGAWAYPEDTFCVDGIIYSITSEDTVQVGIGHETGNGLKEKEKEQIVIPLTVEHNSKNYKVTDICEHAFEECTSIISVTMSGNVKRIKFSAFEECPNLETIIIPDSVTEIRPYAFASCGKIKEIKIPDSVTSLCSAVFAKCTNLEKVTISKNIEYIADRAFFGCDKLESVSISSHIKFIGWKAFDECFNLKYIYINQVSEMVELADLICPNTARVLFRDPENL